MFDMVGNIFRNLSLKPATRNYPLKKRPAFELSRGRVRGVDINACIFCGICARKCPADAITVDRAGKTWEIDPFKCVICGACAEACPKKCIVMDEQHGQAAAEKATLKYVQPPRSKDTESQAG
jgi:formate hydrogenlyase subunit 6/NADH:ubiquinone oxidoreductase subunit I